MVIPSAAGYCRFGEYVGTSTPAKTGDADAYEFCILSWLTRICSCRLRRQTMSSLVQRQSTNMGRVQSGQSLFGGVLRCMVTWHKAVHCDSRPSHTI